ncbi:hypothetical protein BD289DRAFT_237993 [Coniella lustricola]|uniref:Uncharacterized protein n=1 Tax=Coniella lustricola TaxID=2025994 RepID=A0A2T3AL28_9PEZI|nr:hypothetical protein BD289DRAFT_237993 [Coniella lustricola]
MIIWTVLLICNFKPSKVSRWYFCLSVYLSLLLKVPTYCTESALHCMSTCFVPCGCSETILLPNTSEYSRPREVLLGNRVYYMPLGDILHSESRPVDRLPSFHVVLRNEYQYYGY